MKYGKSIKRALEYTHFELKNIVIKLMKANFQSLFKLNYRILFFMF